MSKYIFLGVAAILAGAASAAKAFAEGAEEPAGADKSPDAGGETTKRGRGRPAAADKSPEGATAGGPTDAERLESNKALIKPLVDDGQGEEVKKIIAKYSKTGLKDLPAANQADFEKDIAAISF